MISWCRFEANRQSRHAFAVGSFASLQASRTTAYRWSSIQRTILSSSYHSSPPKYPGPLPVPPLRSQKILCHPRLSRSRLSLSQLLHTTPRQFQQPRSAEDIKDPPREQPSPATGTGQSEEHGSQDEEAKNAKSEDENSGPKNDSKKDEPPQPPHGDKSPWQVFTETLRSEFKASKEWNESTKQLASSAHQLTESESVKRARAAYDATAGAATSKTAEALKTTGKALGQGAAWTWDTKMVQGIRGGVNATGRGIERATRPVRETKTFQSIKEAVDDGSSSRYGGWVEKEERRKKKELRDLKEMQSSRRTPEKMEEDPK